MKAQKKKLSKSAFILGLPGDMPVMDVVAKAKGAGLDVSVGYVHTVRSGARRGTKRKVALKPGAKLGRPQLPPPEKFSSLREYVLRRGIDVALAEFGDVRAWAERLIDGR